MDYPHILLQTRIYICVTHRLFRDGAIAQMTGTGGLQRVPRDYVENFQIPLPPLEVQRQIVAEIEGFQMQIKQLEATIAVQEQNIQKTIARVWGVDETQGV